MKIVINTCFGGFGISTNVLKELVIKNAKCIESYTPKHYYGGDNEKYHRAKEWEQKWNEDFQEFFDIGDGFMTDKMGYNVFKDGLLYSLKNRSDIEVRTDSDLINIIERIGEKEASASLAELKVVEIPDGIEFEIDDYDGVETIHEVHRSWS